jgi:hypothetical protein
MLIIFRIALKDIINPPFKKYGARNGEPYRIDIIYYSKSNLNSFSAPNPYFLAPYILF